MKLIYNGVEYKSISALCRELGLPKSTINSRRAMGMSIDEAVDFKSVYHTITRGGVEYANKREMCKIHGVNYHTFKSRVRSGLSDMQALTKGKKL